MNRIVTCMRGLVAGLQRSLPPYIAYASRSTFVIKDGASCRVTGSDCVNAPVLSVFVSFTGYSVVKTSTRA